MSDSAELALVMKAILSGISGCFEWHEGERARLNRTRSLLEGLTLAYIKQRVTEFVSTGGEVQQVQERRPEYGHRAYYYKAIIPEPDFPNGIFVEMELTDDDPELPCVTLLNAHPQSR